MSQSLPIVPDFGLAVARLREIAALSADHLLLGDGPPHPDGDLLELCAETIHLMRRCAEIKKERDGLFRYTRQAPSEKELDKRRLRARELEAEDKPLEGRLRSLFAQIRNRRSQTPAGIYAKALVVRGSTTGAPVLAMGLADELINCEGLRQSLWTVEDAA